MGPLGPTRVLRATMLGPVEDWRVVQPSSLKFFDRLLEPTLAVNVRGITSSLNGWLDA
jgi:hypothetical protein